MSEGCAVVSAPFTLSRNLIEPTVARVSMSKRWVPKTASVMHTAVLPSGLGTTLTCVNSD